MDSKLVTRVSRPALSKSMGCPVTARKDDPTAADLAATAKVAVPRSAAWDGGLIQTTSG